MQVLPNASECVYVWLGIYIFTSSFRRVNLSPSINDVWLAAYRAHFVYISV